MNKRTGLLVVAMLAVAPGCEAEDLLAGLADAGPEPGCPSIIYVNQLPATFHPAPGTVSDSVANTTPLIQQEVVIPEPAMWQIDWRELIACVRARLEPYGVEVTDENPGAVDHTEIYVAADPTAFGFSSGLMSRVSASCQPGPRDLGFAFWRGNIDHTCEEGVAAAIGALTGLDLMARCEGIMSGSFGIECIGERSFLDEDIMCGQEQPAPCRCGGDTQNSHRRLLGFYGAAPGCL